MRRHLVIPRRFIVLSLLSLLLLATGATAAERVAPEASGPASKAPPAKALPNLPENAEEIEAQKGQPQTAPIVTRRPARTLTPMMAEVFAYMESRDLELAAKKLQLTSNKSDATASATLQQEMQKHKFDTEIEVLRIQARHATKEGRLADAKQIEESIEERIHPKVTLAPEKRPAPNAAIGR